jgi:hypothetical protein
MKSVRPEYRGEFSTILSNFLDVDMEKGFTDTSGPFHGISTVNGTITPQFSVMP